MALKKSITQYNGVVAGYHRIDNIGLIKRDDNKFVLSVNVAGYVDVRYRNASPYNQVSSNHYSFILDSAPLNIYEVAYEELKKLDMYAESFNV